MTSDGWPASCAAAMSAAPDCSLPPRLPAEQLHRRPSSDAAPPRCIVHHSDGLAQIQVHGGLREEWQHQALIAMHVTTSGYRGVHGRHIARDGRGYAHRVHEQRQTAVAHGTAKINACRCTDRNEFLGVRARASMVASGIPSLSTAPSAWSVGAGPQRSAEAASCRAAADDSAHSIDIDQKAGSDLRFLEAICIKL